MGYNIEVSFNIVKHGSVTELQNKIQEVARESICNFLYHTYEFENNTQYKRNHCLFTINFDSESEIIDNFIYFIKNIKKINGIYIESIYDENVNILLYASKYYQTQLMDKYLAKNYKQNRRTRSYSEDHIHILSELEK
jgi:hypothetical protein